MHQKKIILVTGGTGAQGGSVARALLSDNNYSVRILTRNAASEKALDLQAAGAEIVTGDLDDIESLKAAMKDCYGVFGVTNFWEHFEKEYEQGINLVDAVAASGIKHFVLHTLPGYSQLSKGEFPVPHCDIKAALKDYTKSKQLPATFIQPAFYYENFFSFFPPQLAEDGAWYFGFPQGDTKLSMLCIEDLGGIVLSIFKHPAEYIGRTVGAVGADDTCTEYATTMSKILQRTIRYKYIPRDEYAAYGFPGAEELANMFEVQRLYISNRQMDLIESYGLNPAMQSFESWLKNNVAKFEALFNVSEAAVI